MAQSTSPTVAIAGSTRPGDVIDNERLTAAFQSSTQGGIRRSNKTNTLVLVSDHVASIYDDRWVVGIFLYTGMGMIGDQQLEFMQNKALMQLPVNGVDVHLFKVDEPKRY